MPRAPSATAGALLRRPGPLRVLVVAAHPDDESLGATRLYRRAGEVAVLCLTDGAPRLEEWRPQGDGATREEYAARRRRELAAALDAAGVPPERRRQLEIPDQELVDHLPWTVGAIVEQLVRHAADLLVTHPYEGGHPDHDAAALAAARAVAMVRQEVALAEAPSYHRGPGGELVAGRFLPAATDAWQVEWPLDRAAAAFRRRLLACHRSQRRVLECLPVLGAERLRPAPEYDFSRPPHPGRLHYEALGFPFDGAAWRARAAAEVRGPVAV